MAEMDAIKQAKAVYSTLCAMLDAHNWKYEKDEEHYVIQCGVQGDDLPMDVSVQVDPDRLLVILLSPMPFRVEEAQRKQMAIAVSVANYGIVDGSFDYDYRSGKIIFRMTTSYRASLIGKELFEYMLAVSCNTIDEYNDKFLMVAKKPMSTDEIMEIIK